MRFKMGITAIFTLTAIGNGAIADDKLASQEELYTGPEFKKAFANPKENPKLPRVLLIGDSISIGYTIPVRKKLHGKANVYRIKGNGQHSGVGRKNIKKWIGTKKWDVIHFNWGLWDLCYRNPKSKVQGHRDKVNGKLTMTPEAYRENMEAIVAVLKTTGAKLIWCATTPVPDKEAGRIKGDAIKYNKIAAEIMEKNGIQINDLYSHALKGLPKIQKDVGNVHFTSQGYEFLSEKVAAEILKALK